MTGATGTIRSGKKARQQLALVAFFLLIVGLAVLIPSHATSADQNPIEGAKLGQKGRSLVVQIRTDHEVNLSRLDRRPDFTGAKPRYLCLQMNRRGGSTIVRICLGGRKRAYRAVGVSRTTESGTVRKVKLIPAKVKKLDKLRLVVTFDPRDAGLPPGGYAWRIAESSGRCSDGCLNFFPPERRAVYRLRPVVTVGCTGGDGELVTHGPRGRKRVALTFDDGPSDYTPRILRILERKKARATFFVLGQQVGAYPSYARAVVRKGHELANHSYSHDLLPGESDMRRTSRRIRSATGFRPCLFRPPYGAVNGSLLSSARKERMKVVNWDVDTNDWKVPGVSAIVAEIVNRTRPGSIVLMHDGGGSREGTVDALGPAISALRDRGFRFVTVTQLLGNRFRYRPMPR